MWIFCKRLRNIKNDDLELHSFNGLTKNCKVTEIYDGDTITIVFKNCLRYEKYKLRMYGYDSPEIKPKKNIPNRNEIIELAKTARDALKNKILHKIVKINYPISKPLFGKVPDKIPVVFNIL